MASSFIRREGSAYRGDAVVHGVRADEDRQVELPETGDLFVQFAGVLHRRDVEQRKQQRHAARLFNAPRQLHRLVTRTRDDDF
jgi:hypothetical protein